MWRNQTAHELMGIQCYNLMKEHFLWSVVVCGYSMLRLDERTFSVGVVVCLMWVCDHVKMWVCDHVKMWV